MDPLDEARSLLRPAIFEHAPVDAKKEAVYPALEALFSELLSLNGYLGLKVTEFEGNLSQNERRLNVRLNDRSSTVGFVSCTVSHGSATLVVGRYERGDRWADGPADVPVVVNMESKMFEGTQPDEYRAPVPGQPRARRAASAVVIETLLPFLTQ